MGRRKPGFNKGRWAITREWHRIPDHEPPAPSRTNHASRVIDGVMKSLGLEGRQWLVELEEAWPSMVGDVVAAHTRPGQVIGNRLIIFVDSSVWLSELSRYHKAAIMTNLSGQFGDRIKSVNLRLDPDSGR